MRKLFSWAAILLLSLWLIKPQSAFAVNDPNFPSCPNPGGDVLAQFSSGIHGIPGDLSTHTGSDTVFRLNETQLVQCFCADSGTSGIQTNWWKVGSLDEEQINQLKNLGWIFIPDGSAWGLDPVPYLAQNLPNACGGGGSSSGGGTSTGGGGGGGSVSTPTCTAQKPPTPTLLSVQRSGTQAKLVWTAVSPVTHYTIAYGLSAGNYIYGVSDTGNVTSYTVNSLDPNTTYFFAVRAVNDCMPGDLATLSFGGIGGQVLGLATTGDAPTQLLLLLGGGTLILLGALVLKTRRN